MVLGLDFGTESLRVGLFAADGTPVASVEHPYPTAFPRAGWAEQDPGDWWAALQTALAGLRRHASLDQVVAAAVAATSSTVVVARPDGEPLAPAILWMDSRAEAEAEAVGRTGHPVLRYSGGRVSVEWMTPKALWLKHHRPGLLEPGVRVVEAVDWLNFRLTGRWAVARCNAVCKWNYLETGWDPDFFAAIGLPEYRDLWPQDVLAPGEPVEYVAPHVAAELGLPARVLVVQGAIDAHLGLLGMGITDPGQVGVTMGTSFVHLGLSEQPYFHPGLWGPYPGAVYPHLWLLEGGQISAGSITRWFRDHLAPDLPPADAYQRLTAEAAAAPPGADGLVLLDYWQGNRTPLREPRLSGAVWGFRLHHTRGHLYRAILEGVACGNRHVFAALAESGYTAHEVIVAGGITRNEVWLQILADVLGQPLRLCRTANTSVLGAAVAAAAGAGIYASVGEAARTMTALAETVEPRPEHRSVYDDLYGRYRQTQAGLGPLMLAAEPGKEGAR